MPADTAPADTAPADTAPADTAPAGARGTALAGTAAVVLALAAGKWGAYLGVPPVFPIDALLAVAAAHAITSWLLGRPIGGRPGPSWPGWPLAAFTAYPLGRFLLGPDHSLVAIRDYAPYGYALVAFLAARSDAGSGPADRRRTVRLLDAALLFHLAWVGLVLLAPGLPARLPLLNSAQQLHLLDVRYASDGTVVGVTAALYFVRFLRGGGRRTALVVLVALAEVLSMVARASLLSTAVALALACWLAHGAAARSSTARRRRLLLFGLLPLCLLLAAALVPHTAPGSKLLSSVGLAAVDSREDEIGIGTRDGRSRAWRDVLVYLAESHRTGVGVGFGPDYLQDSGARRPLGNSELLRLPHSFLVGTYARLGLVGLAGLAALLLALVRAAVRLRRAAGTDDLLLLALVLPIAFLVSGSVGVQIESPFGAVPFWWCLGVLLRRSRLARTAGVRPASRPDRPGPDRAAPDRAGPDRAGPDRAGPDRAGPDRAGPDRAGPDRAGPDRGTGRRPEVRPVR